MALGFISKTCSYCIFYDSFKTYFGYISSDLFINKY